MKQTIILIMAFSFCESIMAGGGWTPPKGTGYFKLSQSMIYADKHFAPDGSIIDITTTGLYSTALYGEYGITDRFAIIAYVPFFVRNTLNEVQYEPSGQVLPGDELNAFGDIDVQFQYGFIKSDKWVGSARLWLGLPSGKVNGGESQILQTGDGEFNQMLRIDAGRPLGNKFWTSAYLGYNNRTKGFSDEWRVGAELGFKFSPKGYIQLRLDAVQSTFNGEEILSEGNSIFANNTEFVSPALEVGMENKKGFGLSLSAAGAFAGRNVLAAPNLSVGIYYQLRN